MITLSTRTKEAIKTGLAMTIAYAIALSMDWDSPHWAGIAVAVISLQDRERFYATFQQFADKEGLALRYSRKALSKRTRR